MKTLMLSIVCILSAGTGSLAAQDYGCDKCSMLQEEYEAANGAEKDKIYAFFKQECLQTDTVFVTETGGVTSQAMASNMQVVEKGKCIDYKQVKEFEKSTKKETRSYRVTKKDTVYTFATTAAIFPGGDTELVSFLVKNVKYPEQAKDKKAEGTVYLRFVVQSDGTISQMKALRSPDAALTAEAIRVVKTMPKWEPARYKKEAVSMMYVLPVKFRLN